MELKSMRKILICIVILSVLQEQASGWFWRRRRRRNVRYCQVGHWSSWSSCNHICGSTGTQTRTRSKTVTECCGGSCPYSLSSSRPCNRNACKNGGSPIPGSCACTSGWTGTCCEIDRDECLSNPCDHKCVNVPGSYNCSCNSCYTKDGDKCKKEKCNIGQKCFDYGDLHPNNQCQDCQQTCEATWTNNNTLSCNDNNLCTRNDVCKYGICSGTPCRKCERCSRSGCKVKQGFCVYKGKCYRKRGKKSGQVCRKSIKG
ncbi:sushi, nidogen and EGF-like domain-containing protein 1 [Dendronephthya gigantea]|uniref:sushi, nidogen and EGF-like domain-containing protein 1 n=1 Tax=Dendronephthya gigantea TaxID=151771 RepID=UPI00106A62C0|nr:sushi, nidogen and EGF-like domain-containing protein 1 [Dendronephthya gigantea]XP_028418478.1 sushi, nidogen and EGF-like domain-containing protein 1 [Dendronephthya gigantea]